MARASKAKVEAATDSPPFTEITEEQLRSCITKGERLGMIDVLLPPALCAVTLEYNTPGTANRPMRQTDVTAYGEDYKARDWINTGDPFIFSNEGHMINGQHRAKACVDSGVPIIVDLRFGIPAEAFPAMDTGRRRTGSDVVHMMGVLNAHNVAAVARLIIAYERGLPSANYRRINSGPKFAQALKRWPDLPEGLTYGTGLAKPLKNSATLALGFFGHRTTSPDRMRDFFHIMHTGEGDANSPPHRLQKFITRHGASRAGLDRVRFLAVGIKALNAWKAETEIRKDLTWTANEPFPVVEGLTL